MGTLPESVVNRLVSVNPRPSCAEADADSGGGRRLPPLRGGDTRPKRGCSLPLTPPLMLPRTDCRKRSSSIRSLVLFENAMLGIATILPVENVSALGFRERRAGRLGRAERIADAAPEERKGSLALGSGVDSLGGDNSQLYKKCFYTVSPRALQPGEPGVANGRRPIFLSKEMKQQETEVKKAG